MTSPEKLATPDSVMALAEKLATKNHLVERDQSSYAMRERQDARDALRAEVSRLATGRGWLPIESAPLFTPLDGPIPPCLVYAPGYGVCMGAAGQDKFGHKYAYINSVSGSAGDIVTHFMPLPAAPGAAQGEVN